MKNCTNCSSPFISAPEPVYNKYGGLVWLYYLKIHFQRGVGLVAAGATEKPRPATTTGKVSLEDLDGPGSINGVPALEFNIDTIEDKPWNKPGADISGTHIFSVL